MSPRRGRSCLLIPVRCRANSAQIGQSRPYSGLGSPWEAPNLFALFLARPQVVGLQVCSAAKVDLYAKVNLYAKVDVYAKNDVCPWRVHLRGAPAIYSPLTTPLGSCGRVVTTMNLLGPIGSFLVASGKFDPWVKLETCLLFSSRHKSSSCSRPRRRGRSRY